MTRLLSTALILVAHVASANEVSVRPMDGTDSSWVLTYSNGLTPSGESQNGQIIAGENGISWMFERTPNAPCGVYGSFNGQEEPSADTIFVIPPDGYIAAPDVVTINEGDSTEIFIVPELMF